MFGEAGGDGKRALSPRIAGGALAQGVDERIGAMIARTPAGGVLVGGRDGLLQPSSSVSASTVTVLQWCAL